MNNMVSCNKIRRLIDEADHPESLSFEASSHVASCPDCGVFAEDRTRLRRLLASGSRVSVPMNFDAVLKARLAQANARSAFAWLSPAASLKLGATAAGLVVMIFAAQYGGLFSKEGAEELHGRTVAPTSNPGVTQVPVLPATPPVIVGAPTPVAATAATNPSPQYSHRIREVGRTPDAGVPLEIPGEDYLHQDGGVMLVRGPNGEGDVSLPMVSFGAQSLVYASAGASPRSARTIGTSF